MLEIRNITKIYRSKKGESVRALDNVSIQFPESGMVFLLGKSGSGKSTLLNVIGGLDSYDSGEFVIMGKSSADFVGSDFDAYRNTFIGFIFQEYNVLDDFTVGANIGLALELQGKKATNEAVNAILEKVDLVGYAGRKPNELSGGQKQRVAIARALVKDPQIIMADEPTGALDSATGKQIFDTLKELSREKLVLVVSHDRDFAERYADRIIELSDGHIIDDVIKEGGESTAEHVGVHRVSDTVLRINSGYVLTQKDLEMINAYLANAKEDVILSSDRRVNAEFAAATDTGEKKGVGGFTKTDPAKIRTKKYEKEKTRFIRSRLPMKNAVKMGASGLKHKKFRLVMTILLSFISFAMFGLADTMAAYDQLSSASASILDSHVKNASVMLGVRHTSYYGDEDPYSYYYDAKLNQADIDYLKAQTGLNFLPVYNGSSWMGSGSGIGVSDFLLDYEGNSYASAYRAMMAGLVTLDEAALRATGFTLTGRMPQSENEIVITEFMYRQFNEYGFENTRHDPAEKVEAGKLTMDAGAATSVIGKHLSFPVRNQIFGGSKNNVTEYEIVGVIDTAFDYERYAQFFPTDNNTQQEDADLFGYVLSSELEYELGYGFHTLGFMTAGGITRYQQSSAEPMQIGTMMHTTNGYYLISFTEREDMSFEMNQVADSSAMKHLNTVVYFDGRAGSGLKENELLIPKSYYNSMISGDREITLDDAKMSILIELSGGREIWNMTQKDPENDPRNIVTRYRDAMAIQYIYDMVSRYPSLREDIELHIEESGFDGSAEEYWIREWIEYDNGSYPNGFFDVETMTHQQTKTKWDFDGSETMMSMVPFFEAVTGIDFPDEVTYDMVDGFRWMFERFYEGEAILLNSYEVQNALRSYYTYLDVFENKLWENEGLVELLIASKRVSSKSDWIALGEEQPHEMLYFYRDNYIYPWEYGEYYDTVFRPTYTSEDFTALAADMAMKMSGVTVEELLRDIPVKLYLQSHETDSKKEVSGAPQFVIAGYYESDRINSDLMISDTLYQYYQDVYSKDMESMKGESDYREEIAEHAEGEYAFAIAPMPKDKDTILKLLQLHYAEEGPDLDLKFRLRNAVMSTLDSFDEMIEVLAQVFLWVGLGFAVFSAFLLMNFIATSISYKKREIGILRAVGARSSDVFKIFFSESAIIALINFCFAVAASLTTVIVLNNYMRKQGINITLLNFGVRQVILMLGISIIVALIASFLPVWNIARRKPVDAIKDR